MPLRQLFLGQTQVVQDYFTFDMCEAFLAANIPWTKKKIPNLIRFWKNIANTKFQTNPPYVKII
jgi:hypothetical protein